MIRFAPFFPFAVLFVGLPCWVAMTIASLPQAWINQVLIAVVRAQLELP